MKTRPKTLWNHLSNLLMNINGVEANKTDRETQKELKDRNTVHKKPRD